MQFGSSTKRSGLELAWASQIQFLSLKDNNPLAFHKASESQYHKKQDLLFR